MEVQLLISADDHGVKDVFPQLYMLPPVRQEVCSDSAFDSFCSDLYKRSFSQAVMSCGVPQGSILSPLIFY